jgi:hypothetical protein
MKEIVLLSKDDREALTTLVDEAEWVMEDFQYEVNVLRDLLEKQIYVEEDK